MKKQKSGGKKMADFTLAFTKLESFEDSRLTGVITKDEGGKTRFGVAENFHPELTKSGFFGDMPHDEALDVARGIARADYWNTIHGDDIESQDVANKILDIAYNCGLHNAGHIAQSACVSLGSRITIDNVIGKDTVAAINLLDEVKLLAALRIFQLRHYEHIRSTRVVTPEEWESWITRTVA